jgi:hypothetical protein
MMPAPHGWQQSDVCEQPGPENGMQLFDSTQMPGTSGLSCRQTRPGAHVGGDTRMLPPHGPPGPDTQPQVFVAVGRLSHVAPAGQKPPHVPPVSAPHGFTQSAAGPPQQLEAPVAASRHRQSCSHVPSTQRSAVHGLPSAQSASVPHDCPGSVVVVVVDDGSGQWNTHS